MKKTRQKDHGIEIEELQEAILNLHGCKSKWLESVPIKEIFRDQTVWEGYIEGQRRIVTVDHLKSKKEKYGPKLLNKMIEQSGLTKKDFYLYLN